MAVNGYEKDLENNNKIGRVIMKLINRKHIWLFMFIYSVVGNLFMVTSGAQTNSGVEKLRAGIGSYERGE